MKKELMYREHAKFYDLIYSWKDYKKESEKIKRLIKKHKKTKGKELLEVACGTGNYLRHLEKDFNCTGIDLNKGVLKIAKDKLPNSVKLSKENMINFKFNKKFDIILCLFSSIGYVKTKSNLKKTIENFSRHLKEGGVLIIEPWISRRAYKIGSPHMDTYSNDKIKISRMHVSKKKGNLSVIDFHFTIAEKNKGVQHFIDRHEIGMFEHKEILSIMKYLGIKTKFLKTGRGLFIGIKK